MNRHLLSLSRVASVVIAMSMISCGGGGDDADDGASAGDAGSVTEGGSIIDSEGAADGEVAATDDVETAAAAATLRRGEGTFYGATGQGHCSFEPSSNRMVAAMNHTDYAGSAACGTYVRVTGPKGTVTVRIVDECPECAPGDIDLSSEAFARIADPVAGRVPITWRVVRPDLTGPVQYRYKEGSTRWWTAIQVRNHELPIARLQIRPAGASNWINVQRMPYNYFVHPTEIPPGPLKVRITSPSGSTLVDTLPEPQGGLVVRGRAQFP